MLLTTVVSLAILGQRPLPGGSLPLEEAKEQAHSIFVAEVGRTGDRLAVSNRSIQMWTELKPLVLLKGKVTGDELNTHPLVLQAWGSERFPEPGEVLIFFLGDGN